MRRNKKERGRQAPSFEGFTASPHRAGRRVIGQHQASNREALLKEDSTSRKLDDFNRPNGYNPSQPLVTGTISNENSEKLPSMLNTTLPGSGLNDSFKDKKDTKRRKVSLKTKIKRTSLIVALLLLTTVGFIGAKGLINFLKVFGSHDNGIQASVSPDALKVEGDGNINILLLGIGGVGHDGPDLTDTILLASIDPVNHKASLLSVPRDLWVSVPGHSYMKLNAVYETGKWKFLGSESDSSQNHNAVDAGFNLDNQVISGILGIPIKYDVLLDFQAFQQIVDTLGGISLNVPTELYDPTIAWQNNGNPVIAKPGLQNFNGAKALLYVRSRETTSDFARTQRQRAVVLAIKDKAFSLGTFSNPVKLAQLSDEFGNNIVTNLSVSDVSSLYSISKKINDSRINSIGLADPPNNFVTTTTEDYQSVVEPTAGPTNYSAIQYYVRNMLRDGYLAKENAKITVLNGSSDPSLGTDEANVLKSYGYNITSIGNAPTQNYSKTTLVDLSNGADPYTLRYLELRLKTTATSRLPDNSIHPGNANFVIILGQDESPNS